VVSGTKVYLNSREISGSTACHLRFGTSSVVKVVDLRVPTAPVVAATATAFTSPDPYSGSVTGQGDLGYAVKSNGGRVNTYRYMAGVLGHAGECAASLYPLSQPGHRRGDPEAAHRGGRGAARRPVQRVRATRARTGFAGWQHQRHALAGHVDCRSVLCAVWQHDSKAAAPLALI
jgi:hypothetical protein